MASKVALVPEAESLLHHLSPMWTKGQSLNSLLLN